MALQDNKKVFRKDFDEHGVKIYEKGDYSTERGQKPDRRRWKNENFFSSLHFALTGIVTAIKEESNMRKHLLVAIIVLIAGLLFQINYYDWLMIFLALFLVISMELMNSAIENVVDLAADYNFHMRAKRAKDMAAGAVLLISCFSVVVGLFVFLPKIWSLFF
ncbi:diacylglycerol kinase family protein [Lactovum miscens]|uniref:Undecaprenol kinase n=1 Tax=Lactovum miscens TaxID=190387 RepID=A0A841C491_9LACT|nr:diacylglycerol kinase family protein [Lactovum miscens]MBB5887225.1 undecaprenol kinase [Lactovum miscens]